MSNPVPAGDAVEQRDLDMALVATAPTPAQVIADQNAEFAVCLANDQAAQAAASLALQGAQAVAVQVVQAAAPTYTVSQFIETDPTLVEVADDFKTSTKSWVGTLDTRHDWSRRVLNDDLTPTDLASALTHVGAQAAFRTDFQQAVSRCELITAIKILVDEVIKIGIVKWSKNELSALCTKHLQPLWHQTMVPLLRRVPKVVFSKIFLSWITPVTLSFILSMMTVSNGEKTSTLLVKSSLTLAAVVLMPRVLGLPVIDCINKMPSHMGVYRAQGKSFLASFFLGLRDWFNATLFYIPSGIKRLLIDQPRFASMTNESLDLNENRFQHEFVHPEFQCVFTYNIVREDTAVLCKGFLFEGPNLEQWIDQSGGTGRHPFTTARISKADLIELPPELKHLVRKYRVMRVRTAAAAWHQLHM